MVEREMEWGSVEARCFELSNLVDGRIFSEKECSRRSIWVRLRETRMLINSERDYETVFIVSKLLISTNIIGESSKISSTYLKT